MSNSLAYAYEQAKSKAPGRVLESVHGHGHEVECLTPADYDFAVLFDLARSGDREKVGALARSARPLRLGRLPGRVGRRFGKMW